VRANVNTDELGNLGLSEAAERAIVAFMRTVSDGYAPAAGQQQCDAVVRRSPD
jgi:hypothetical protein